MNSNVHNQRWPEGTVFGQCSSRDFSWRSFPFWKWTLTPLHFGHPLTTSTTNSTTIWPLGPAFLLRTSPLASGPCWTMTPSGSSLPGGFSWVMPASAGRGKSLVVLDPIPLGRLSKIPLPETESRDRTKWQRGKLLTLEMTQKVSQQVQIPPATCGLQKLKFKGTGYWGHVTVAFYPKLLLRDQGKIPFCRQETEFPCGQVAGLRSPNRGPGGRGGPGIQRKIMGSPGPHSLLHSLDREPWDMLLDSVWWSWRDPAPRTSVSVAVKWGY